MNRLSKQQLHDWLVGIFGANAVSEQENRIDGNGVFPYAVYWDFLWDYTMASGEDYEETETYQVSMFSKHPREPKVIAFRNKLKSEGIFVEFQKEYNQVDRVFHYYLSLEVYV